MSLQIIFLKIHLPEFPAILLIENFGILKSNNLDNTLLQKAALGLTK